VTLAAHFAAHRIMWSRFILVGALLMALVSEPPRYVPHWLAETVELSGYVLLVAAALWRIWCLVFIGGAKNNELVIDGPYSVVRNPLYVGTFLGAIGFGLAMALPWLSAGLAILFAMLYPGTVAAEEARLAQLYGERFRSYCERVPRWIPAWSKYSEPERLNITPARVRDGIVDAMWFLWAFAFVEMVDVLREYQLLTPLF